MEIFFLFCFYCRLSLKALVVGVSCTILLCTVIEKFCIFYYIYHLKFILIFFHSIYFWICLKLMDAQLIYDSSFFFSLELKKENYRWRFLVTVCRYYFHEQYFTKTDSCASFLEFDEFLVFGKMSCLKGVNYIKLKYVKSMLHTWLHIWLWKVDEVW